MYLIHNPRHAIDPLPFNVKTACALLICMAFVMSRISLWDQISLCITLIKLACNLSFIRFTVGGNILNSLPLTLRSSLSAATVLMTARQGHND